MKTLNLGGGRDIALSTLLLATTAFAWVGVIQSAAVMHMPQMAPLSGAAALTFTLEWGVMMTAMMLPSAAPMILLYGMTSRRPGSSARVIPGEIFAIVYVVLWFLTGVPIYFAWVGIGEIAARSKAFAAVIPYAIAATVFAAGAYQLSSAKHACLRQCESPIDFLMRRWRAGYAASLRLAATHAAYCIGCCWALMVLLVVAGAMSLPWVLAIALLVFAEKVLPGGERTARISGVMLIVVALAMLATACATASVVPEPGSSVSRVPSKDGTLLAFECTGVGPSLVVVHGGTGDRSRWTPLFPLFASRFRICAMDRRGHGASGDSRDYSLQKEAEDVAAVVNSQPGQVFLLGHSFGAVAALEAAFLTSKVSKLVLYEPPLQQPDHSAVLARMEKMIEEGDRESALVAFMQEIVMISPSEIAAMKARPSWPRLVATVESSIRQDQVLVAYRFDPKRMSTLNVPTLLLTGSKTASPQLKQAISGLLASLPNRSLFVFEGQEHNAMDAVPQQFAEVVGSFLLGTRNPKPLE